MSLAVEMKQTWAVSLEPSRWKDATRDGASVHTPGRECLVSDLIGAGDMAPFLMPAADERLCFPAQELPLQPVRPGNRSGRCRVMLEG